MFLCHHGWFPSTRVLLQIISRGCSCSVTWASPGALCPGRRPHPEVLCPDAGFNRLSSCESAHCPRQRLFVVFYVKKSPQASKYRLIHQTEWVCLVPVSVNEATVIHQSHLKRRVMFQEPCHTIFSPGTTNLKKRTLKCDLPTFMLQFKLDCLLVL